jgi:hypothetical protein
MTIATTRDKVPQSTLKADEEPLPKINVDNTIGFDLSD